jgi:hypothetical protein
MTVVYVDQKGLCGERYGYNISRGVGETPVTNFKISGATAKT